MTEQELVRQVESMRDVPDAWGEPDQAEKPRRGSKSERRQRGAMVSVRLTPDELAAIQAHASRAGTSVSGYLRNLALAAARQPVVSAMWVTGAVTNCPGTSERLVTREVVGSHDWLCSVL
jgi:hypothetical protein